MDVSMPGTDAVELVKRVKAEQPQVAVLVHSMHAESAVASRMLKAGASGYITKDSEPEQAGPGAAQGRLGREVHRRGARGEPRVRRRGRQPPARAAVRPGKPGLHPARQRQDPQGDRAGPRPQPQDREQPTRRGSCRSSRSRATPSWSATRRPPAGEIAPVVGKALHAHRQHRTRG